MANQDTDGNVSALVSLALRREIQRRVGLQLVAEYGIYSELFIPWAELRAVIDPDGPAGKLVPQDQRQ